LRAWRGAIDFVGQDHVGENRPGAKFKFARLGVVHADAEDVARQQIGSKLNALKGAMKGFGQRLREGGFAHSGNVFDQQVAAGQQGDQGKLDGFFFTVDGARDAALQLRDDLRGGGRHWLKTRALPVTTKPRTGD
jgi:hypothetical protein